LKLRDVFRYLDSLRVSLIDIVYNIKKELLNLIGKAIKNYIVNN